MNDMAIHRRRRMAGAAARGVARRPPAGSRHRMFTHDGGGTAAPTWLRSYEHPAAVPARARSLDLCRCHDRETVRSSLDDSVYAGQDLAKAAPKYRFPNDEWRSEDAYAVVADELHARRQLAPEPGDVLPDVGGAAGPPS